MGAGHVCVEWVPSVYFVCPMPRYWYVVRSTGTGALLITKWYGVTLCTAYGYRAEG